MATLEEIAAKNRKLGLPANANAYHRGVTRLNDLLWKVPSSAAAIPTRGAKNILEGMLFGPKSMKPGPTFGKRFSAVNEPGKRYAEISKAEYDAIKGGEKSGKAFSAKSGPLGKAYFKQRYIPGGMVGFAKRHPLMAAGGGALAYYLATNPGARQAAGGMASGMTPQLRSEPTAAVQKEWAQPSYQNPLASDVWGK